MNRAALLALVAAAPALAWESVCYRHANPAASVPALLAEADNKPCEPAAGPSTTRQRWVGPLDEHRQLWARTHALAGIPDSVDATQTLTVFTSSSTVPIGKTVAPTLVPAAFENATRVQTRSWSPGELSQLPDFSYALWDWASGNETCPADLGATDPQLCHDFASHMGPVNANHFLPQAQRFYRDYHQLALARAAECKNVGAKVASQGTRFAEVPLACLAEAMSLEAVGHHYLQDAWSMGHMWERWGSSNLADFPGDTTDDKRDRAVLVALVSGLFHGARGVLQLLPAWTGYDVDDALCAPWDGVKFTTTTGVTANGVGDDYAASWPTGGAESAYAAQASLFDSCAVSGMLDVYRAAGEPGGAATPSAGLMSVDPLGDACFGQRATNASMALAAAVNFKVAGQQVTLPLDARFVSFMLPKVARSGGKVPVAPKVRNEFRKDLVRIVSVARLVAKDSPDGLQLATGRLGTFLGAKPNGQYTSVPSTLEPALPWNDAQLSTEPGQRAAALARAFHVSHAADLCATTTGARLEAAKTHARDASLDADGKAAACLACTELALRHLRIGTAAQWDTSKLPLCEILGASQEVIYQAASATTSPRDAARTWCCP